MTDIANRIKQFTEEYNKKIASPTRRRLTLSAVETICGFSNSGLRRKKELTNTDIARITSQIPEINPAFLLTGEGSPLIEPTTVNTTTITTGDILGGNNNIGHSTLAITQCPQNDVKKEGETPDAMPIIPREIYDSEDIDVYEYCIENAETLPASPRIRQLPRYDLCYPVVDDEMKPMICAGDKLYLRAFEPGCERYIVPGRAYVIDTKTNGLITRKLYHNGDHFIAHPMNSEYPDHPIAYTDITRIYRIVGRLTTYM